MLGLRALFLLSVLAWYQKGIKNYEVLFFVLFESCFFQGFIPESLFHFFDKG